MAPKGKHARNTTEPHWAKDMYRTYQHNLQKRLTPSPRLNQPSQRLRQPSNMRSHAAKTALTFADYAAREELQVLNSAKSELQQKIEMMVQHHVVIREHEEPVVLNEDQRGAVGKWHWEHSKMQAASAKLRVRTRGKSYEESRRWRAESAEPKVPGATAKSKMNMKGVWPKPKFPWRAKKAKKAETDESAEESDESGDDTETHRERPPKRRRLGGLQPRRPIASGHQSETAPQPTGKAASAHGTMTPHLCNFVHEVLATDAFNVYWTKDTDQKTEWALREQRNNMIMRKLQSGQPVAFKSGGNSLAPLIKSGDICEYYPVSDDADVGVGDIVFCQVNPTQRYFAHAVMNKTYGEEVQAWYYSIGNASGWENGWCWIENIYGKLKRLARDHVPEPFQ